MNTSADACLAHTQYRSPCRDDGMLYIEKKETFRRVYGYGVRRRVEEGVLCSRSRAWFMDGFYRVLHGEPLSCGTGMDVTICTNVKATKCWKWERRWYTDVVTFRFVSKWSVLLHLCHAEAIVFARGAKGNAIIHNFIWSNAVLGSRAARAKCMYFRYER